MADQPERRFNNRPESTIAQTFAADLDSMFGLNSGGVEDLCKTVEEKKQTVSSREQQLQELEAKLRETEQRLAQVFQHNSPPRQTGTTVAGTPRDNQRAAGSAAEPNLSPKAVHPAERLSAAGERVSATTRAGSQTSLHRVMPEMAQHAGNSEYVMVDRNAGQAQRGFG